MASREERRKAREDRNRQRLQSKAELLRQDADAAADRIGKLDILKGMISQTMVDMGLIDDPVIAQSQAQRDREYKQSVKRMAKAAGPAKVFASSAASQEFSKLTQNLGAKILRLGSNVPPDVQQLAADAVNGTGGHKEAELQEALRGYMGIKKSGATKLRRLVGGFRNAVGNAARIGVMWDVSQRGGAAGALAQADMVQSGAQAANRLTKNKAVEAVVTAVAAKVFSDPAIGLRLLRGIGRVARLAGGVTAFGAMVAAVGEEYFAQRSGAAKAQGASFDASRANRTMDVAGRERARVAEIVRAERSIFGRLRDALGFNQATEEEISRRSGERFKTIATTRENIGRFGGGNSATILSTFAAQRGRTADSLSDFERAQALNPGAQQIVDRLEASTAADHYADSQLARRTWMERLYDSASSSQYKIAQRKRFRREFAEKSAAGQATIVRKDSIDEAVARYRSTLSKSDNLLIDRANRDGIAQQESHRNRHKVVWDD